jgi:hypothetical protein
MRFPIRYGFLSRGASMMVGLIIFGCSTDNLDARALANSLAEEFAEQLEFQDGEVESGSPPSEEVPSPKIIQIDGPRVVGRDPNVPDAPDY